MTPDMNLGDTQLILQKCREHNLSGDETAYVLATAFLETNRTMKPVREAYWLPEEWRRANLRYYPWYGRGYVQLTWKRNYRHASNVLGVDLIKDRDAAMRPEIAAEVLVKGMQDGWFTGHKLSDYFTPEGSDFVEARRMINGTDRMHEFAEVAKAYRVALPASTGSVATGIAAAFIALSAAVAAMWDRIANLF